MTGGAGSTSLETTDLMEEQRAVGDRRFAFHAPRSTEWRSPACRPCTPDYSSSLSRYPIPGSVWMILGFEASLSILARSWPMKTLR